MEHELGDRLIGADMCSLQKKIMIDMLLLLCCLFSMYCCAQCIAHVCFMPHNRWCHKTKDLQLLLLQQM
jgi:hypothetical protein